MGFQPWFLDASQQQPKRMKLQAEVIGIHDVDVAKKDVGFTCQLEPCEPYHGWPGLLCTARLVLVAEQPWPAMARMRKHVRPALPGCQGSP